VLPIVAHIQLDSDVGRVGVLRLREIFALRSSRAQDDNDLKRATAMDKNANLNPNPKNAPIAEETKMMTGAGILWECLEREGVRVVFGYPGGAILPAYDALKHSKIHHVLVRHEQGATNMVTGIATAMLDSIPIVCITGQVGSKLIGSDAFQETDITGVTLPIT